MELRLKQISVNHETWRIVEHLPIWLYNCIFSDMWFRKCHVIIVAFKVCIYILGNRTFLLAVLSIASNEICPFNLSSQSFI